MCVGCTWCMCVCVIGAWSRRNLGFTIELIRASFRNFFHMMNEPKCRTYYLSLFLTICISFMCFNLQLFLNIIFVQFCMFFSFIFFIFFFFNLVKIQFYTCFSFITFQANLHCSSHPLSSFLSFFSYAKCKKNTTKTKKISAYNTNMKHTRYEKNTFCFLF